MVDNKSPPPADTSTQKETFTLMKFQLTRIGCGRVLLLALCHGRYQHLSKFQTKICF